MRKWMADRLKRRKKNAEQASSEPKTTPLQPAYFDAASPAPPGEPEEVEPVVSMQAEPQEAEEAPSAESDSAEIHPQTEGRSLNNDPRNRRRRRRGGRGRGRSSGPRLVPAQEAPPAPAEPLTPALPTAPVPPTPRPPKGVVILAIGLPGSGKSSWFKRNNIVPLSTDMLRTLLFDDATEQRFQDLVFSNLRSMLKARLIARRPMNYVDATNLTPQERHSWIKLAKDFGYEVQAVYFDVPVEVCLERNQRRERVVDENILRRMAAKLKAPTFNEGFTKIKVVKVKKRENQPAESATADEAP
jgi:predicted kinase